MTLNPYIPDVDSWKNYFKNPAKYYKDIYVINKPVQQGKNLEGIKLVSPTAQMVEQARSTLQELNHNKPTQKKCIKRKANTKVQRNRTKKYK